MNETRWRQATVHVGLSAQLLIVPKKQAMAVHITAPTDQYTVAAERCQAGLGRTHLGPGSIARGDALLTVCKLLVSKLHAAEKQPSSVQGAAAW